MNDPANYARCAVPHASLPDADTTIQAFYKDVAAARTKHRIAEVVVLVQVNYVRPVTGAGADIEVAEATAQAAYYLGAWQHHLPMIARAYGQAREEYDRALADIIATARAAERRLT